MSNFYIRPDAVRRTGVVRPYSDSNDLHAEVASIARAFTSDSGVTMQYGPAGGGGGMAAANVPKLEVAPGATSGRKLGFFARFFGAK